MAEGRGFDKYALEQGVNTESTKFDATFIAGPGEAVSVCSSVCLCVCGSFAARILHTVAIPRQRQPRRPVIPSLRGTEWYHGTFPGTGRYVAAVDDVRFSAHKTLELASK